ncbi:MAG TPA: 50S ribosomal protein L15 [Firmicutes bacterium]|nr:50S ribosomal protein L15 [Bacillota bacterium]
MRIHTIQPAPGAVTSPKRLGRGTGSGLGKTSGKGHKGQWARSGGGVRIGFEGGQMPLTRRLPKRGFTNNWRKEYSVINIGDLECFDNGATVTPELIFEMGLAADKGNAGLKVLSDGTLTKQLTVKAHKFSKSAIANIEKAGGKAEVIE